MFGRINLSQNCIRLTGAYILANERLMDVDIGRESGVILFPRLSLLMSASLLDGVVNKNVI